MSRLRTALLLVLALACETGGERVRTVGPSPFDTPEGRLALYRTCIAEHPAEACRCARMASGESDPYTAGRLRPDPTILSWVEREAGISCAGRDAGR